MSALAAILRERIARDGPIPVADYMALALGHPEHGYYMTRDPLGAAGDFTTAPEISQMFGELLGLWCADTWRALGAPDPFHLVELGPGRGTLAADMLRALGTVPAARPAARLHLVETSPVLRAEQARRLGGEAARWHAGLDTLPAGPAIVVANEFLDALPVRQFVRRATGWHERLVGLDPATGGFVPVEAAAPDPAPGIDERLDRTAEEGDLAETSPAVEACVAALAARVVDGPGAVLVVDYGYGEPAPGETLQAVRGHRPADPLAEPGGCDLTAHVNFRAVARAGEGAGARAWGPVTQGELLERLGIRARAARLARDATPAQRRDIETALARLIGPCEMGTLFKALAIAPADLDSVAGFPAPSS